MPDTTSPVAEVQDAPAGGAQPANNMAEREFTVVERNQWSMALRRFLRHRVAVASLVVFVLLLLFAFVLPHFWRYKYNGTYTNDINSKPNLKHPFGTDSLGYDQLAFVMRGTQTSLKIALSIAVLATIGGGVWGVVAGYFGGFVDSALMRLADLILTIPPLAWAAALAHHYGGTWYVIALVLGGLAMPYVARVVRGVVLSLREREFVEAARALGASNTRIMFRHLIPNSVAVLIVNATLLVAGGILGETALSFFGFGVRSPDTSLGLLTQQGQSAIDTRPWLFYPPGLMIVLVALTINFIGDGLRDALDPRQTRERR
jgi:ABC-type dipeptide/oligopeptide/nickel transport system permease subunit